MTRPPPVLGITPAQAVALQKVAFEQLSADGAAVASPASAAPGKTVACAAMR
jgi:hypothetical protein